MKIVIFLSSVLILASCASTRVVKKRSGKSGVIMVKEGMFGDARADAKQLMKDNCGRKKPVIAEEGEAVVGSDTRGSERKRKGWFKTNVTYGSSETRDVTEWRIKYRCKGKKRRR